MKLFDRPYCLTIGGFDPSAGAGVLADVKVFEQLRVYGLAVNTANTVQTDQEFSSINYISETLVFDQVSVLSKGYDIKSIKIGLIADLNWISRIRSIFPYAYIVWDPVLSASTGVNFHDKDYDWLSIVSHVDLLTPNGDELRNITMSVSKEQLFDQVNVMLKGGHVFDEEKRLPIGTDMLYVKQNEPEVFSANTNCFFDKHGTGCVLSSCIAAYLALDFNISNSCLNAKRYVERISASNESKLAFHNL